MFDIFAQVRALIKSSNVRIDNNVFTLHYRLSVIILVVFSLVIGSRKYFGDPIDCTGDDKIVRIVDNFCWFNSYILIRKDPEHPVWEDRPRNRYSPVISEVVKTYEDLQKDPHAIYDAYFLHAYQWIEFILFLQALLFFIPRYLWRYCWEQGRVKALTENFALIAVKKDDNIVHKVKDVVGYLKQNRFSHFEFAGKYVICEVLNFINVLTQFCLIRSVLGIEWQVLAEDFFTANSNVNPENPLNTVFPNVARCEVPSPTGASHVLSIEFCVLPVNVFTTKMYIFLWFYFLGLTLISGISLLYRLATIVSPHVRCFLLKRVGQTITEDCTRAIRTIGFGEWFMIDLIGKNMDSSAFKILIKEYNDELVASRPSFAIGSDKIYNADISVIQALNKDSQK